MTSANDTKEQQDFKNSALATLNERLGNRELNCQLCGEIQWGFESKQFYVPTWDAISGKPLVSGSKQEILPLVALTCLNCGNTLLINAKVLGLTELVDRDS